MRNLRAAPQAVSHVNTYGDIKELRDTINNRENLDVNSQGLRSLLWQACLCHDSTDATTCVAHLSNTRQSYVELKQRYVQPLEHMNEAEGSSDPLSEEADSTWDSLRKDEALRKEIYQDVDRCMPDNLYFRQPETQTMLIDILFTWSKLNPNISYRQGMHEIAAPVLWVVERDAVDSSTLPVTLTAEDELSSDIFASTFIEHDTFALFNVIMTELKSAYEHTSEGKGQEPSRSSIGARCTRIMEDYLSRVDPALADHLLNIEVVPQVFLLRWIRLLFGREFSFDDTLLLWDRLFATGYSSETVDMICVAMILRLRWHLLEADYNTALQLLMRYSHSTKATGVPGLVDDALYLSKHLHVAGGAHIITKRTGRPPTLPDRPSTPAKATNSHVTDLSRQQSSASLGTPHRRSKLPSGLEGMLEDASRGLYTRGERLGLNKAVRDVVLEVKKNVQTVQARTHSRMQSLNDAADDEAVSTRNDTLEARLTDLQSRNDALAKMLDEAVTTLWNGQKEGQEARPAAEETAQAVTAAIAKVQFVQVYLADPSLALPIEPAVEEPSTSAGLKESVKSEVEAVTASSTSKEPQQRDEHQQKISSPTPSTKDEPAVSSVGRSAPVKVATTRPKTSQAPKPARPTLEQSSFSWMLGQEEASGSARKTFMSAAPFKEGSYRGRTSTHGSNAYLFGDAQDDPFVQSKFEGKPKDKASNVAAEKERLFQLGTLRGKKGGDE